jgi:cell envelope-related function transcriptional attenuator common domain
MTIDQNGQEPIEDYYDTTSIPVPAAYPAKPTEPQKKTPRRTGPKAWVWVAVALAVILLFFTPFRINILILGIDPNDHHSAVGRSDTMIMTTIPPVTPRMTMLSIPRDLWVDIPGHGQNRINTAHFFAEAAKPGSGLQAAADVVEQNFHVSFPYQLRIQVEGFKKVVDAMGGVTVTLPFDMSGYKAGTYHLDSTKALALVRDREGSDDFYRQMRGQIFIKGAAKQMLNPLNWWRIPGVFIAATQAVTTNIPFYLWPRIAYSAVFSAATGFNSSSLSHNMVQGYITADGADVLLPKWELILPYVQKLFH